MRLIDAIQLSLAVLSPFLWLVKSEVYFRLLGAIVPLCWSGVSFYLGIYDGAIILLVISLRALCGLFLMGKSTRMKSTFALLFITFFTAALYQSYEDYFSILPWFAACFTTLCQLYLSGVRLRLTQSIGADGAWIMFNAANSAWGHLFEKIAGVLFNLWTVRTMVKANLNETTPASVQGAAHGKLA